MIRFQHDKYLMNDDLISLYRRMEADRLLDVVFYNTPKFSVTDFIQYVRNKNNWMVQVGEYGFFWLNGFQGLAAQVHFCFWRDTPGKEKIALESMQWLHSLGHIKTLYGVTPVNYRAVIKFLDKMDFKKLGKVTNLCYLAKRDTYVSGVISMYDLTIFEV